MSFHSRHLIRYGLAVLTAAAAVGCKSDGTGTDEGEIAIGLNPTSASVVQGGNTIVIGTLTRSGGFTGAVQFGVTGNPSGVTAVVSNEVTTGLVTTATLTVTVGPAVTPLTYPLVVTGTGSGVTPAPANFALTVTAAPAAAYTMTLSAPALTIVQGAATPTTTVTLVRTNFTGNVALTVENLPTGVTAAFVPPSPISGNTSVLTLTVLGNAPTGTFTNLLVRGVATGLIDRTAPLSLTITAPGPTPSFTLSLTASALTIAQGASTPTTTVNITRTNFTGDVTLSVLNLPTGVTASFAPANPISGNSSVLTLTVPLATPVDVYNTLAVQGVGTAGTVSTPLTLTVTAAAPTPSFTLSLTAPALTIAQGASTPTTTVNITRTNFTGDVTLSVLNLPTGVTAAFVPANPISGNSSVLTLTVPLATPVDVYNTLAVQGVGTAGTVSTPLTLTVTAAPVVGNFTLTTTPLTSVSLSQSANANVTVNINRTGGNTSNIALTVTGTLPAGMTAVLTPTSTTTNSSVLTITTTGATPVSTTPIVIRGNVIGLLEQTANLNVIVTAPGGSGNVRVSFAGCPAEDKAVWLAFMDGTSGTWTAVTAVADLYQFNITQSKGSFAYVTLDAGNSPIFVQHMTQAELTAATFTFCGPVTPPPTRVANGTVSNLPTGFLAQLSWGRSLATPFANGAFQIVNASDGTFDLIGYASSFAGPGSGDRVFVKRGENPAPGGNFSVPVNFLDATLSTSLAAGSATLQGLVGGETLLNHSMSFFTGGSACVLAPLYGLGTTAASFTMFGVPASLRVGTDLHSITLITSNGTTSSRFLTETFLDVVARAATPFVLPAQLPVPVATDAGGPYKRPSIAVTGVPAELNLSHSMTYQDQTATGKFGFVSATQGWVGGPNFTLVLPNFAGVGTFNNAWAPATGDALNWSVSSVGGTFGAFTACAAGSRFVSSTRSGTL